MAPFVPYHSSAGQATIVKFGGLLTTEFLEPPPGRCFLFRQTYRHTVEGPIPENLRKLINSPHKPKGPPPHFHQFQTEYFRVETGVLGIEVDGVLRRITPEDGEISVKAGSVHRFFIHPDSPESMTVYLSASDSGNDYQLDRIFFENWYGYWHDALLHDGGIDWIQFLAIQDGGDAYTPAPAWVPFRRQVGYWTCVIVGRWIGGLLGYKPFFREYTTDWDFAVAKMKGSVFQRHLVHEAFGAEKSWKQQTELEARVKPENAEFEQWTEDMSPTPLMLKPLAYEAGEFKGLQDQSANGVNGHATGVEAKKKQLGDMTRRRSGAQE
ncbi:uncharacterized protein ACLA_093650 [Aspergillus clavatus NRRL 1]|uniref:Probable oxidoreductase patJ n=1 Tax=Aspergillus clavatus (strain ATCC 1007 / CBS 513.65 / DSM 816 / NCTC 3887 / NRRL 1 / QM 1276 / 107) TaxID=344612 RepID=PATJ_ASPCL|nr:uncharacterized protein ACLA_093650 [Aspergillus clavatus NRRL 1]A1CFL7.1 RecName: Full=Probable oxidoreductase patJ; AltName: Full=Patulin synthesis protein J [Aspergillus clavatus NRRL 1]EAW11666.1 conserved hypothetical protein [Aspergillus clavatus NRRL 1]